MKTQKIMNVDPSLFIILALITSWGPYQRAEGTSEGSHSEPHDDGGDINGEPTDIKRYPYIVEIQHYNRSGEFWYFRCVGSIMNANTILTACHCITKAPQSNDFVEFKDINDVRILAGMSNRYSHSKAQTVTVEKFLPHPQCRSPPNVGYSTDVAVIKLGSDLNLSADGVKKVKIFSRDPTVVIEEQNKLVNAEAKCSGVGWGLTEASSNTKNLGELQVANMRLISSEECSKLWCNFDRYYCNEDLNQYNFICAVNDDSTMCQGDSGGPLICNDYLFGVDNLSDEMCNFRIPTIFADMNSILYFVDLF